MQFNGLSRPPFIGAALFLFMANSPMVAAQCVDSDGDGWGWDGSMTCIVPAADAAADPVTAEPDVAGICVDPDGDGWGWDGSMTCVVEAGVVQENPVTPEQESPVAGICVDPDGDGWGWDGSMTCIVEAGVVQQDPVTPEQESPVAGICVDPDGDGWGWDGSMTCLVEAVVTPENPVTPEPESDAAAVCLDPDGDGWGWDGSMTCMVEAEVTPEDPGTAEPVSPVTPPIAQQDPAQPDPTTPAMMQCSIDPNNPPMLALTGEGEAMRNIALLVTIGDTREEVVGILGEPVAEEPTSGFVGLRYTSEGGTLRINNETNQLDAFSLPTVAVGNRGLANACPPNTVDTDDNPNDSATCANNQACAIVPVNDRSYQWTSCEELQNLMTDGVRSSLLGADRQRVAQELGLPTRIRADGGGRIEWFYSEFGNFGRITFNRQTYEALEFPPVISCP